MNIMHIWHSASVLQLQFFCSMHQKSIIKEHYLHSCNSIKSNVFQLFYSDLKLSIPKPGASIPTVKLDNVVNSPNNRTQKIKVRIHREPNQIITLKSGIEILCLHQLQIVILFFIVGPSESWKHMFLQCCHAES